MTCTYSSWRYLSACYCQGQALVETIVVANAVLIVLLLWGPMLAKYVDIKHKSIQAARYQVWEATVWRIDGQYDSSDLRGSIAKTPVKSKETLANETMLRFYGNVKPVSSSDGVGEWNAEQVPRLWRDHSYSERPSILSTEPPQNRIGDTENAYGEGLAGLGTNTAIQVIDTFSSGIASALNAVGVNAGFTVMNTAGRFNAAPSVVINEPNEYLRRDNRLGQGPLELGLRIGSQAGLTTNSWSAGGKEHMRYQARGLVVTSLFDNPVFNTIKDITAWLFPEFDKLEFGYIDFDAVHPDRLEDGGDHACISVGKGCSGIISYQ